jgi:hypothetical protein
MNSIIGDHDFLWLTLDTLRFDVAQRAFQTKTIPNIASYMTDEGWELRHSPGNFTYAAHHAFFAGFLPTPATPGPHPRLFAASFLGSETTTPNTFQFEEANVIEALRNRGYRTMCIGGVGFFNKQTPLGLTLPSIFTESFWSTEMGVTCPESTENQVNLAIQLIRQSSPSQRLMLFINVSALHQPNFFYLKGAVRDSAESQQAALCYVDRCLAPLFEEFQLRAPTFCLVTSDHGTAYGESGYHGHRLNHPVVGEVPYVDFILPQKQADSLE